MDLFHVTIGWDGYDDLTEGQISFHRENFPDALFGAKYYLEKYLYRGESNDFLNISSSADLLWEICREPNRFHAQCPRECNVLVKFS